MVKIYYIIHNHGKNAQNNPGLPKFSHLDK